MSISDKWEADYPAFTTEVTILGKRITISIADYLELVARGLVDEND